jgi:hypothetical protein
MVLEELVLLVVAVVLMAMVEMDNGLVVVLDMLEPLVAQANLLEQLESMALAAVVMQQLQVEEQVD